MVTYNRITWLPKVLRDAGIEVVLHEGWETRGLGAHRPFDPKYVVWHHDASAEGDSPGVPDYMIRNFDNAGAQVWIDRQGRWHIIASGRAAHAGATRNHVENENSIGIETDHTTGEDWPPALLESLRKGTAAIFMHMKQSASDGLHFHKSICEPVGRKVDPDGLDLGQERKRVAWAMEDMTPEPHRRKPTVSLKGVRRAARIAAWARVTPKRYRDDVALVRAALKAEGFKRYAQWQRSLGYRGKDANGVPGETSLKALGRKHGFRVVE